MLERRAIRSDVHTTGRVAERRLEGYAATFGAEARIANFVETIAPGAFGASLDEHPDILALVDHDPGRVLARTRSGNLELMEDRHGLKFNLRLPDTTAGRDVYALARSGDLGGMSFAFSVEREKWDGEKRTLEQVKLHEISVVSAWPAYPDTMVQARSRPVQFARVALARRFLETL